MNDLKFASNPRRRLTMQRSNFTNDCTRGLPGIPSTYLLDTVLYPGFLLGTVLLVKVIKGIAHG